MTEKKTTPLFSLRIMTTLSSTKTEPPTLPTPRNFCAVPHCASLCFHECEYIFKGSVLERSSARCDVEADFDFCLCLLILLFVLWASSFLVVDCETTRMFFIFVRSHPQHLFPIWQILEQKFLGEKLMVAWWFKNKLFAKNPPPILHPTPPPPQCTKALSTLLPAALLLFPLLVQVQTKSPHRVLWERL